MIACFHCQTESDDCVADYEGLLTCSNCNDAFTRARWLADKARRERVEEAFQEQDSRLERDGCYVPYDPPTPQLTKRQAGGQMSNRTPAHILRNHAEAHSNFEVRAMAAEILSLRNSHDELTTALASERMHKGDLILRIAELEKALEYYAVTPSSYGHVARAALKVKP